jgi:hypothetical protein
VQIVMRAKVSNTHKESQGVDLINNRLGVFPTLDLNAARLLFVGYEVYVRVERCR